MFEFRKGIVKGVLEDVVAGAQRPEVVIAGAPVGEPARVVDVAPGRRSGTAEEDATLIAKLDMTNQCRAWSVRVLV
ncbi:MAG TPA: hypothetical protein VGD55_05835, partial [Acidothermaceae bacterium]